MLLDMAMLGIKKSHGGQRKIDMLPSTLTNEYGSDQRGNSRLSLLLHRLIQQPPPLILICPCPCDNPARPQPPQGTLSHVKGFAVSCPDRIMKKICLIFSAAAASALPSQAGLHTDRGGKEEQQILSCVHLPDLSVISLARILY